MCLTRRKDKRDAQCFAHGVVPPPTVKDFVVTKTKHVLPQDSSPSRHVDAVGLTSSAAAAAFARCTLCVSVPPYATEGLYLFKYV